MSSMIVLQARPQPDVCVQSLMQKCYIIIEEDSGVLSHGFHGRAETKSTERARIALARVVMWQSRAEQIILVTRCLGRYLQLIARTNSVFSNGRTVQTMGFAKTFFVFSGQSTFETVPVLATP